VIYSLGNLRSRYGLDRCPIGAKRGTKDKLELVLWANILYAVSLHSCESKPVGTVSDLSSFLILVDELSECRAVRRENPFRVFERVWDIDAREEHGDVLLVRMHVTREVRNLLDPKDLREMFEKRETAINHNVPDDLGVRATIDDEGEYIRVRLSLPAKRQLWTLLRRPVLGLRTQGTVNETPLTRGTHVRKRRGRSTRTERRNASEKKER
jgi:hypothetical protein